MNNLRNSLWNLIIRIPKKTALAFMIISMLSCINKEEEKTTPVTKDSTEAIRYLALGDSYTIGQGVEESMRWPNQLGEELRQESYHLESIYIIAKTGWTTGNLLNAIQDVDTGQYNLVSLLIGVNNQYQNKSFSKFNLEFDSLLSKSIQFAGDKNKVFVVSIPDYGVTPFGSSNSEKIKEELDMYNAYMSKQCMNAGIPFIDITEISRELGDSEGALASDNLHPSGSQYTSWVNKIRPMVLDLLEK